MIEHSRKEEIDSIVLSIQDYDLTDEELEYLLNEIKQLNNESLLLPCQRGKNRRIVVHS